MNADLAAAFEQLVFQVRGRLERGAVDLEDRNLDAPPTALLNEVKEELEDICGWATLLWHRVERLRPALRQLEEMTND